MAALLAELDATERQERNVRREALRAQLAELDALDAPLAALDDLADLIGRAALTAAGYRQHHRGEWRKRRAQRDETR